MQNTGMDTVGIDEAEELKCVFPRDDVLAPLTLEFLQESLQV